MAIAVNIKKLRDVKGLMQKEVDHDAYQTEVSDFL